MTRLKRDCGTALAMLLVAGVAACAPQPQAAPPLTSAQGTAAPQGMQGHSMAGMDMRSMMAHCAQMRQQTQQGARASPEMQQMMVHCDQMDRPSGSQPPR